jgi:hypothetical protein
LLYLWYNFCSVLFCSVLFCSVLGDRRFERLGQSRQQCRHVARDLRADACGVQAVGVLPDAAQAVLHLGAGQVGQLQAVAARVGVGGVGAAGFAELGVHLDHGADIDHQHEGRATLVGG